MGADFSSGHIIQLDLIQRSGLIQDDYETTLILHFDFTNFHPAFNQ